MNVQRPTDMEMSMQRVASQFYVSLSVCGGTVTFPHYTVDASISIQLLSITAVPPELTAFPRSDRDIVSGENLVVSCTARGRPQPVILWKRNGTLLTVDKNIRFLRLSDGRSELQITNFIESDSGPYTCTANNTLGNSLASFQVNLIGKLVLRVCALSCSFDTLLLSLCTVRCNWCVYCYCICIQWVSACYHIN